MSSLVVLSRLLEPSAYGLAALVAVAMSLSSGLANNCIERAAFLYSPISAKENLFLPLSVAVIGLFGVFGFQAFFSLGGNDVGPWALAFAMVGPIGASLFVRTRVVLRRLHKFSLIVLAELSAQSIGAMLSIGLALNGAGAFAVIAGAAAFGALPSVFMGVALRRHISFNLDFGAFLQSAKQALNLARVVSLEFLSGQIPATTIGQMLGLAPLGLYNRAYAIVQLPIQLISNSFNRVATSTLRANAKNTSAFVESLAEVITVSNGIVAPIAGGLIGSASTFVGVLLGDNFASADALVAPLAVSACCAYIGGIMAMTIEIGDEIGQKVGLQLASIIVFVVAICAGAMISLEAASWGFAIGNLFYLVAALVLSARKFGFKAVASLAWMLPGFAAAVICALAAMSTELIWNFNNLLLALVVKIAICGVSAAVIYALFFRKLLFYIVGAFLPESLTRILRVDRRK